MAATPSPIFTALPLSRGQTTSQSFKDHGANALAPGFIGEVKVTGFRPFPKPNPVLVLAQLWAYIASIITSADVPFTSSVHAVKSALSNATFLTPLPSLIVHRKTYTDTLTSKLENLGFNKMAMGKYQYFRGAATETTIREVSKLEVEPDSYCPKGNVSLHGALTFYIFNQVLHHAFMVFAQLGSLEPVLDTVLSTMVSANAYAFTQQNLETLPAFGLFFAYFDGLLLPDRAWTVNTFVQLFSPLLGASANTLVESASLLMSGWASLHDTTAGRVFSHMVFMVDNAVKNGWEIRPVFLDNEYCGMVVVGKVAVLEGSRISKSVSQEILRGQIEAMVTHSTALSSICEILSSVEMRLGQDTVAVTPLTITSPRALHYAAQERKLTEEASRLIRPHIKKLKFQQTFFALEESKIALACEHILLKKALPVTAPFYLGLGDNYLAQENILSVLLAFGPKAPSLIGFGNNIAKPISKDMYRKIQTPGNLAGIPIFTKSVQDSFEDWKKVTGDQLVTFSHGGKDKMGRMKVKGANPYLPFDSAGEKKVMDALVKLVATSKDLKRKDREDEPPKDAEVEEKRDKRRKKGMGIVNFGGIAHATTSAVTLDDAMVEDDFFN